MANTNFWPTQGKYLTRQNIQTNKLFEGMMKHQSTVLTTLTFFLFSIQLFAGIGIGYSSIGVLPVELTAFSAFQTRNIVTLEWSTATEVNNYGFEIQRFADNNWVKIGFVSGHGNSNSVKNYSFIDITPLVGTSQYHLKQLDNDGKSKYSYAVTVVVAAPSIYQLNQNFPNPFNPTTVITYQIPSAGQVSLKVYDSIGKLVTTLVDKIQEAGKFTINFDGNNLSNGIYFYKLQTGNYSSVKKMLILK